MFSFLKVIQIDRYSPCYAVSCCVHITGEFEFKVNFLLDAIISIY